MKKREECCLITIDPQDKSRNKCKQKGRTRQSILSIPILQFGLIAAQEKSQNVVYGVMQRRRGTEVV